MAASFSLASADVDTTNPVDETFVPVRHEGVQITVRNGRALLHTDRGAEIEIRHGVLLSTRVSRSEWSVTFTDGTTWSVARSKKGCRRCG